MIRAVPRITRGGEFSYSLQTRDGTAPPAATAGDGAPAAAGSGATAHDVAAAGASATAGNGAAGAAPADKAQSWPAQLLAEFSRVSGCQMIYQKCRWLAPGRYCARVDLKAIALGCAFDRPAAMFEGVAADREVRGPAASCLLHAWVLSALKMGICNF